VRKGEVVIIDEFTGRMMPAAVTRKGCIRRSKPRSMSRSSRRNVTLASITFQNYFRLYGKLAGMTGTAATEADEICRNL